MLSYGGARCCKPVKPDGISGLNTNMRCSSQPRRQIYPVNVEIAKKIPAANSAAQGTVMIQAAAIVMT